MHLDCNHFWSIYSNSVFCFSVWLFVLKSKLYIPFSRLHWSSLSYQTPWICPLCWCYITLPAWAGIAVAFWHLWKMIKSPMILFTSYLINKAEHISQDVQFMVRHTYWSNAENSTFILQGIPTGSPERIQTKF